MSLIPKHAEDKGNLEMCVLKIMGLKVGRKQLFLLVRWFGNEWVAVSGDNHSQSFYWKIEYCISELFKTNTPYCSSQTTNKKNITITFWLTLKEKVKLKLSQFSTWKINYSDKEVKQWRVI